MAGQNTTAAFTTGTTRLRKGRITTRRVKDNNVGQHYKDKMSTSHHITSPTFEVPTLGGWCSSLPDQQSAGGRGSGMQKWSRGGRRAGAIVFQWSSNVRKS